MNRDLQRIETAMEALARVGQSRRAARVRATHAGVELTGAAQKVLRRAIEDGPIRISDLARRSHMSDAVVSRQVTVLENEGLVARVASPEDGRVAMVKPTASGRQVAGRLRRAADEIFQDALQRWSRKDLAKLAELIERLAGDLRSGRDETLTKTS
jgi:DNA-binding MarR family transcriptional regulator